MRNAGIIHHALFWNGNNGLQCEYFINNGLQDASMNRRFLNIIHKPQTRGLSVNSISNSLSLNFHVYFVDILNYFSMKAGKKKVKALLVQKTRCWPVTFNERLNNYYLYSIFQDSNVISRLIIQYDPQKTINKKHLASFARHSLLRKDLEMETSFPEQFLYQLKGILSRPQCSYSFP